MTPDPRPNLASPDRPGTPLTEYELYGEAV